MKNKKAKQPPYRIRIETCDQTGEKTYYIQQLEYNGCLLFLFGRGWNWKLYQDIWVDRSSIMHGWYIKYPTLKEAQEYIDKRNLKESETYTSEILPEAREMKTAKKSE